MPTVATPETPTELVSWTPPAWTETVTVDGDLIECSRTLGTLPHPTVTGDSLAVTLVQRDEVLATADRIQVVRHPVDVNVGGVALTPDDAEGLSYLLSQAKALLTGHPLAEQQAANQT